MIVRGSVWRVGLGGRIRVRKDESLRERWSRRDEVVNDA